MKTIKKVSVTPMEEKTGHIYDTTNIDNKAENTYSAEIIDKFNTYSTTEQVVGTWVDGRPIYRKVLIGTLPSVGQNTFIDIDDYMKEIIKAYSYFYTSANQHVPLPYINSSKQRIVANSYQKQWAFANEIDTNAGLPCGVIIEYTKTTDKANVMINFTVNCSNTNIGNKTYQAEYGMTWREWINSEYNVDGYYAEDTGIRLNAQYYLTSAKITDTIQANTTYATSKGK